MPSPPCRPRSGACRAARRRSRARPRGLSIVQMPAGIPVGTLAIGSAGAVNAALLAAAILSGTDPDLRERLRQYRTQQSELVLEHPDPRQQPA